MSFGKKGVVPGAANAASPAMRVRPAMAPRAAAPIEDPYAAQREAFLAAERGRRAAEAEAEGAGDPLGELRNGARPATRRAEAVGASWTPLAGDALRAARSSGLGDPRSTATRSYVFGDPLKRSLLLAYVFWYFCSPLGLHRIYCGSKETGLYQMGLFFGGLVVMLIWVPLGLLALGGWVLWIIADLFLMPGLMRRFKAEHRRDFGEVFA